MYTFKYLVRIMYFDNSNWPAVSQNFQRAQRKWGRFSRMLFQEGDDIINSSMFYMEVVQYVLLFGS